MFPSLFHSWSSNQLSQFPVLLPGTQGPGSNPPASGPGVQAPALPAQIRELSPALDPYPPLPPSPPCWGLPAHFPVLPAAWICIVRYHQLRDWGVATWHNQLILWSGLLCALGTSIVGNFQEKNQKPTHLVGAFLAFILGNLYFWLQLLLSWRMKGLPQPGAPWIQPLRLILCSLCTILIVATVVLYSGALRSAAAACEWAVAMLLFVLFGLLAVDFSSLDGCSLCLQPQQGLGPPPGSPVSLQVQLSQAL
ncbi:modulator of macroautophagy TMEM150B isoform X1 [Sciurus carolinensis]|uniref:modulator of macroautophagy TMEM150B isoform X1 n=1 Tax=Sciurus carolinensis TaxID=30640 RepID=UPI001FB2C42E|nr:modulator of macroautophagy TMEM150B isoform X1 [Sciurus carolinensis]XP_047384779.1 modulator of macroautophagy TMEM150B isoform X1 [Sciurus carolinensis]